MTDIHRTGRVGQTPAAAAAPQVMGRDLARPVLSVVGLGKLGACTAACFAYRGFRTVGMDVNPAFVAAINGGRGPVFEPQLDDVLQAAQERISGTTDYRKVVEESDVTFLIVPTPSQPDGHFSDRYLRDALGELARTLRGSTKPYHLFVITSTVSPGTTESRLIPLIEEVSGRRLGGGFGVCYNPEFIALGSVIRDFLNPDLVLIGESDAAAGNVVKSIHRILCENAPKVFRMSLVSAEIAKISLNAYVTMKISFANTLAAICEGIPGADIDSVTSALGADRRVSPFGLRGGLPFGGPCFPRDNRAFAAFAARHGVEAALAHATDTVNERQLQRLIDVVAEQVEAAGERKASVLGLAYKPNTPVVEESPGMALVDALLRRGVEVSVYDPLAMDQVKAMFGARLNYAATVRECVANSPVIVITMPGDEFASIDDSYLTHNPATIVDCWRAVDPSKFRKPVRYLALGDSP